MEYILIFITAIFVNNVVLSQFLGICPFLGVSKKVETAMGMGLGFTIALTLLGGVREFLGTGKLFNIAIMPEDYGMLIFVLAPGAFIVLGYLIAIVNRLKKA